jgi:hypothetical protein
MITQSPSSKFAVLRSYGDYLLTVPLIRKANESSTHFENKFVIVKMSDGKDPLSLSFENVGPLQPQPVPPVNPVAVKPAP